MNQIKMLLKALLGVSVFYLFLFLAAGRLNYLYGWIYYTISILGLLLNIWIIRDKPDLMEERSKPGAGAKSWDKRILGSSALLTVIAFVVAGLDSGRFGWSVPPAPAFYTLSLVVIVAGQIVFALAKRENRFFSSVVRIQADRGHAVCNTGLYRFVRHPGYLGMVLSWAGFPIALASYYSAIPVLFAIALLVLRTHLEDKTLNSELPGYAEYARTTRYRLVPGLW